ncbi:cohesin subunit SA-2 isoform X2 [Maniola hyperantus]|uniref:cohesin subunit SA-2 isoform X2 n=1 Tax=Aphantopus hyperantus TaxID=2795564 RepID=UPI003748FE6E
MHRRGGKRIRMDDPPPEYVNPMTPATPAADYGAPPEPEPVAPFNVAKGANAVSPFTSPEALQEEPGETPEEEARSPSPAPTKRITRSRGRGGDGGYVGRLAESPPPPPLRRRGRGGRGRGRGRGAAPPPAYSPPPVLLPGDDENSLYNILRFNKTAINQVVDMWIEEYKTNRESALVQLMQFFINSSGCRGKVTPDMAQMDHTLIIKKMTQEFDEESGEYPLIMTGQTWKKFRSNFCEFIQTLVKMCQYSIIYDQYLMDNIISLLTGLSDSQVRAFRHTATLAVMKLMTALVDVALLTSVNCDNCLRQYEAERLKARDKRASERLEVLVAKRQELEENMEEIKNMLSYMFKSVFVHRYRDTLPDIRAITMSEIGNWMEKFPAHFLDDLYLKYIGWTLHDKVGEVRLRCLQALQPLYECDELKSKLELFTSKFKDRIVSMSLDKETEVAVHAVRLVIAILKMHPDVLTDKDCENVYELVYSSWRGVAAAAGEFLNVRLFRCDDAAATPLRSRRGKQRLPNTPLVRDLVQFFIESELHEHGAYLVDSLIESNPMMKDWECMTDLLLEEAGPGEEALDNRQESSLIELMLCCVRQASTGEPPVGRGASRKHHQVLSKEQAKMVSDDRAKMTTHFMVTLPALLDKFGADPEKLTNLVAIPQYFDLELYTTQRQEGNLNLLLAKIRDIVKSQTEAEVLETCGRTLEYLCSEQHAVYTRCNVARATVTDACVNRYKEAIDEYRSLIEGGETPDADELFNVINSLRKVSIMYMCHNLNDTNIWDSLFEDLPKCVKQNETQMPTQALVYVVRSCFYSVLWSLHELEERGAAGEDAVSALRERLHAYAAHCRDIVADGVTPDLREEAYTSICDLLICFAETPATATATATAGGARRLALDADAPLCDLLNDFVQEFVFVHHNYDERRIEELHKRRNFLAAYCKLIVYNVAPIRRAADVFKHYIKCYNDYGDIIKATLSKAREINKLNCALTMQLAMQALFADLLQRHPAPTRQLPEFLELKELAKRFSVMFGLDAVKNREALTALHRAGVTFAALDGANAAAPPPNLLFLEPLAEFSGKLLKQDKRTVLKFAESRFTAVQWGEEWAPLLAYRHSLLTDAPEERPPPARRHYTRRNRGQNEEEEGDDNAESDSEPPGRRRRARTPHRSQTSRKRARLSSGTSSPPERLPSDKSPPTSSAASSTAGDESAPSSPPERPSRNKSALTPSVRNSTGDKPALTPSVRSSIGDKSAASSPPERPSSNKSVLTPSVRSLTGDKSASTPSVRSSIGDKSAASSPPERPSSNKFALTPSVRRSIGDKSALTPSVNSSIGDKSAASSPPERLSSNKFALTPSVRRSIGDKSALTPSVNSSIGDKSAASSPPEIPSSNRSALTPSVRRSIGDKSALTPSVRSSIGDESAASSPPERPSSNRSALTSPARSSTDDKSAASSPLPGWKPIKLKFFKSRNRF